MKSHRRSLLKGSLAVPLVLTVRTGNAAPGANASVTCVVRDQVRAAATMPAVREIVTVPEGIGRDWLRVELQLFQLFTVDGNGTRVEVAPAGGVYFLGFNRLYWRLIESSSGGAPSVELTQFSSTTPGITAVAIPGARRFALAYVNSDGEIIGYGFERNGGSPITASCQVSAAPLRRA